MLLAELIGSRDCSDSSFKRLFHHCLAVVEAARDAQRRDVVAEAAQLVRLARRDAAVGIQDHHAQSRQADGTPPRRPRRCRPRWRPGSSAASIRRARSRCMHAARKRAPTSLNAAVGPWKSSRMKVSVAASGFSGVGKSKASAQISPSDRGQRVAGKKRCEQPGANLGERVAIREVADGKRGQATPARRGRHRAPIPRRWLRPGWWRALCRACSGNSWQQLRGRAGDRRDEGSALEAGLGEAATHRFARRPAPRRDPRTRRTRWARRRRCWRPSRRWRERPASPPRIP